MIALGALANFTGCPNKEICCNFLSTGSCMSMILD